MAELNDRGRFCESASFESTLNSRVLKALEDGKGGHPLGNTRGAICNMEYFVADIDFMSNIMKPTDWNPFNNEGKERRWNDLTEDQQLNEGGRLIEWYTLVTDKGNISFTQLFGSYEYDSEEYWESADYISDKLDVSMRLHPTSLSPDTWIKQGCKVFDSKGTQIPIKGQTISCLAEKEDTSGSFTVKARFFILGKLPADSNTINLKKKRAEEAEKKAKESKETETKESEGTTK